MRTQYTDITPSPSLQLQALILASIRYIEQTFSYQIIFKHLHRNIAKVHKIYICTSVFVYEKQTHHAVHELRSVLPMTCPFITLNIN